MKSGTFGIPLAVLIGAILLAPWPSPDPEVVVREFIPTLLTVDVRGFLPAVGAVQVSSPQVVLSAKPRSQPTVHLLTAEVPFRAAFTVSVRERAGAVFPFQIKVWSPFREAAVEVWYTPDGAIVAGRRANDAWQERRRIGSYAVGQPIPWRITRTGQAVSFQAGDGEEVTYRVRRADFPLLFEQRALSLTLYASAPGEGSGLVSVQQPVFIIPRQTSYGTTVQSAWFRPTVIGIALLSLVWLRLRPRAPPASARAPHGDWSGLMVLVSLGVLAGWLLSSTPGFPADIRALEVWSQVARRYGPAAITGYSFLATAGEVHQGTPYVPMTFPYPPLLTYVLWAIGTAAPTAVERAYKAVNVLAVAAGGILLFATLRNAQVARGGAIVATSGYMLNPAVLFDAAVWGQSDPIVGFFLLLGAAGILQSSAATLWAGILLASLTKQTGALIAPILLLLGLRRMGIRRTLTGLPTAMAVCFLVLTPALVAGMHPAGIYRPLLTKVLALGIVSDWEPADAIVSQGSFTLWTLIAGLQGFEGLGRLALPDSTAAWGGISYFALSRAAFGLLVLYLGLRLLRRGRLVKGAIFPTIAAYSLGAALLLTRVLPRYVYFGLMFSAGALPWLPAPLGLPVLAILTASTLVGMWGMLVLTSTWYPGLVPVYNPERSPINAALAAAVGGDLGITVGSALNIVALVLLLWAASGSRRQSTSAKRPSSAQV